MLTRLSTILSYEGNPRMYAKAFRKWQEFNATYLHNTFPVQLMVIANYTSDRAEKMIEGETKITQTQDILTTLDSYGNMIRARAKDTMTQGDVAGREMIKEEAMNLFIKHYNGLMSSVGHRLSQESIHQIKTGSYEASRRAKEEIAKRYYKGKGSGTYRTVVYGRFGQLKNQFRGQVSDAFLNHLGALHQSAFSSKGLNVNALLAEFFNRTVEQEEGSHFLQLLVNSTNSTTWMSGGDLNLIDELGNIIVSIQLKTNLSQDMTKVGHMSSKRFFSMIRVLQESIQQGDSSLGADALWQQLKTSGIISKAQEFGANNASSIIKEFDNPKNF